MDVISLMTTIYAKAIGFNVDPITFSCRIFHILATIIAYTIFIEQTNVDSLKFVVR